jgi:hypothetical protein
LHGIPNIKGMWNTLPLIWSFFYTKREIAYLGWLLQMERTHKVEFELAPFPHHEL